ncbi:hypothetical protein Tco_1244374 [Tanacetum coccineum]
MAESNKGKFVDDYGQNGLDTIPSRAGRLRARSVPKKIRVSLLPTEVILQICLWCLDSGIWEALERNTHDLDSIWEETGQDYNFTRSGFKYACTVPVAIPSEAVRTYKRRCQTLCDGLKT